MRSVAEWDYSTWATGGVGGILKDSVVVAHQDSNGVALIWLVDAATGAERPICPGVSPTLVTEELLLSYGYETGHDERRPLLVSRPKDVDTLVWSKLDPDLNYLEPPVYIGGGEVACVGPTGSVGIANLANHQWKEIGGKGLLPMFSIARGAGIVCWRPGRPSTTWLLGRTGQASRLANLDGITGYARYANTDSFFVCLPAGVRNGAELYNVTLFDGASRRLGRVVLNGVHFSGRGQWRVANVFDW